MSEIVSFGEWVQTRRNQLGLSRAGLARLVGCSPVTIKKIERDERRPSVQIAELLAEQLQIPETEQDDFVRRARGEFVPTLISPEEMTLAEAQAPVAEEDAPKHNLPPQTTPFFGREQELADIAKNLADPNCRLLTILGGGGMGKTRLSIEAATQQLPNFTDGVLYVALAAAQAEYQPDQMNPLAAAMTDVLGISYYGDELPETQLLDYLQRKELLFVFDNFEHLLGTIDFISDLLTKAPDIKLLVTSRERLHLQEEWVYALRGLPFPDEDVDTANGEYAAVQLFAQRAKQVQASFDLLAELPAVLRICKLVDGMPLGLELAAALVRHMPCATIADEITREFDLLATNLRNVPDRHRSVRAVFTYSWQSLTEDEQSALAKFSVFRGGFERDAARVIAGASFQKLSGFVDKSLLQVTVTGRYQMHELLRQFAAEQLMQLGELGEETQTAHAHFYHSFIVDQLLEPFELKNRPKIYNDIDNVRVALNWVLDNEWQLLQWDACDALRRFYEDQGWYQEGHEVFSTIIKRLEMIQGQVRHSGSAAEQQQWTHLLSMSQAILGWFQVRLGRLKQAILLHEASVAHPFSNEPEALRVKGYGFALWANTAGWRGKLAQANALLAESAQLFEMIGDDSWLGVVRYLEASLALYDGKYDEAERLVRLSHQLTDPTGELGFAVFNARTLGRLESLRGNFAQAETYMKHSLNAMQEGNRFSSVIFLLVELGEIYRLQGRYEEAQHLYEKGLKLAIEKRMGMGQTIAHFGMGNMATTLGRYDVARYHFDYSQRASSIRTWSVGGPGWLELAVSNLDEAHVYFSAELAHNVSARMAMALLDNLAGIAHLSASKGQLEQALELIALILNHPATAYESKGRIRQLREELLAELPAELVAEAEARGRELDLFETAEALLNEETQS